MAGKTPQALYKKPGKEVQQSRLALADVNGVQPVDAANSCRCIVGRRRFLLEWGNRRLIRPWIDESSSTMLMLGLSCSPPAGPWPSAWSLGGCFFMRAIVLIDGQAPPRGRGRGIPGSAKVFAPVARSSPQPLSAFADLWHNIGAGTGLERARGRGQPRYRLCMAVACRSGRGSCGGAGV